MREEPAMDRRQDDSLDTALTGVLDGRRRRGQLDSLPALLTLTVVAILCGCRTLTAVAEWGRDYIPWLAQRDLKEAIDAGFRRAFSPAGPGRPPGGR
jgi:hypothetical protein